MGFYCKGCEGGLDGNVKLGWDDHFGGQFRPSRLDLALCVLCECIAKPICQGCKGYARPYNCTRLAVRAVKGLRPRLRGGATSWSPAMGSATPIEPVDFLSQNPNFKPHPPPPQAPRSRLYLDPPPEKCPSRTNKSRAYSSTVPALGRGSTVENDMQSFRLAPTHVVANI